MPEEKQKINVPPYQEDRKSRQFQITSLGYCKQCQGRLSYLDLEPGESIVWCARCRIKYNAIVV